MLNLYLDPFLFSCPQENADIKEFKDYIENIIMWEELRSISWTKIYLSEKTDQVLCDTNSYPFYADIEKLMQKFTINYLQSRDIIKIVYVLLQKTLYIEKKLRIREILAEGVQSRPFDHLEGRHELFKDHHDRLLIMMSLSCCLDGENEKNQALITRGLQKESVLIKILGKIMVFDFYEPLRDVKTPYNTKGRFQACVNKNGLYLCLDPMIIWKEAKSEQEYRKALEIYIHQFRARFRKPIKEMSWVFGSSFLQTAKDLGFLENDNKARKLLRACAETALGQTLRATHQLRTGSGAADPQRKRNEDGAWRRDIDHQYHLHYWETAKGQEFASVVIHNDMNIPE